MNNWMLDILDTHKRTRGLSLPQLQELIEQLDVAGLKEIKSRLEQRWFKNVLVEASSSELIQRCEERAREIQWAKHEVIIKAEFLKRLSDPFVENAEIVV